MFEMLTQHWHVVFQIEPAVIVVNAYGWQKIRCSDSKMYYLWIWSEILVPSYLWFNLYLSLFNDHFKRHVYYDALGFLLHSK